ncbi:hypothetical protein ACFGVR_11260 [Mucilaginibacter sp. AW1-3]
MKPCFIILVALCVLCLKSSAQLKNTQKSNERIAATVIAKVQQVPEVKVFLASSGKDPESKHALMIDNEPHGDFKYYEIKMGYGGSMFRTVCRFCVDPHTLKVYYWDVMANDMGFSYSAIIPLTQWRQLRKTAAWNKPHTYKTGKLVALTK